MLFKELIKINNLNDIYFLNFGEYQMRFTCFSGRVGTINVTKDIAINKGTTIEITDIIFDTRLKSILKVIICRPTLDMVYHNIQDEEKLTKEIKKLKKELSAIVS